MCSGAIWLGGVKQEDVRPSAAAAGKFVGGEVRRRPVDAGEGTLTFAHGAWSSTKAIPAGETYWPVVYVRTPESTITVSHDILAARPGGSDYGAASIARLSFPASRSARLLHSRDVGDPYCPGWLASSTLFARPAARSARAGPMRTFGCTKCPTDDSGGVGLIDMGEFQKMMNPNASGAKQSYNDVLFKLFDTDNDGNITFVEFMEGLAIYENKSKDPGAKANRLFAMYDCDCDGRISSQDLTSVVKACLRGMVVGT
eukprot:gene2854-biopygen4402